MSDAKGFTLIKRFNHVRATTPVEFIVAAPTVSRMSSTTGSVGTTINSKKWLVLKTFRSR